MELEKKIIFDLNNKIYTKISAQQGDINSRILTFTLLNGSLPLNLTGHTVVFAGVKADNTVLFNNATIIDAINGKVSVELTSQALAVSGELECQLKIYGTDESLLSSTLFTINIDKSIDLTEAVESTNEFTLLTEGIAKLESWDQQFQAKYDGLNAEYASQLTSNTNKIGNLSTYSNIIESNLAQALSNDRTQISFLDQLKLKFVYGAKGDGTTDDRSAIISYFNSIPSGGTMYFPLGRFKISNILVINKPIKIMGAGKPYLDATNNLANGTIIDGYGFMLQGGNQVIADLGVYCPTYANGFEISGTANFVTFKNCASVAQDHCYLTQSYHGVEQYITYENCESYLATHGFISKSQYVKYVNCTAILNGTNGFGFISDNMIAVDQIGNCSRIQAINCTAIGCGNGFNMYSRDYFSATNANGIRCSEIEISNCIANGCNYGLIVGDSGTAASGTTFNAIFALTVNNFIERASNTNSIVLNRIINSSFGDISIEKPVVKNDICDNVRFGKINSILKESGISNMVILPTGSVPTASNITPINNEIILKTNNGTGMQINNIGGSFRNGDIITLVFEEDNSYIMDGLTFVLKRYTYGRKGSYVVLRFVDNVFYEMYGYQIQKGSQSRGLVGDGTALDLYRGSVFDVYGTGTTANKVSVTNNLRDGERLTVIIRSTSGAFTYGGFDTAKFMAPSGFPLTINYGNVHVSNWVFLTTLNKWVCIGEYTAPQS